MTPIVRSRGSSSRRDRSSAKGMWTASGTCFHRELHVLADVDQEGVLHGVPVGDRHVAAQDRAGDHAGEVDRVLRAAERWRVAELALLEVVYGRAQLDRQGELADPLVHAVLADRLRSEHASVGLAEQELHRDRLGAGVVPGVRVRIQIDLLEVAVTEALERLLVGAGPCDRRAEQPDDGGALGAAETRVAPADDVGRDPGLAVRRPGERDQAPLTGDEIPDLDGVADREDVRVAGAHLLVDADPAELPDLDPGHPRQSGVRSHTEREDHDVGWIVLAGLCRHRQRIVSGLLEAGDAVAQRDVHAVLLEEVAHERPYSGSSGVRT